MIAAEDANALLNAPDIETLWDRHVRLMAGYGFDRLIYGFTRYRTATSLGDPEDFVLLTNHDSSYMDTFLGEEYYRHAPMVRWAMTHDGACSWSVLEERKRRGALSREERRVMAFNEAHGVVAGYSISFASVSPRSKGAMALTARAGTGQREVDATWAAHGAEIQALSTITHLRIQTLPYASNGRSLTPRQREVLEWVGDGKTTQDIALLMDLTPGTVEKHLRLAREALGVETTVQAVLKAAFQNQIFIFKKPG